MVDEEFAVGEDDGGGGGGKFNIKTIIIIVVIAIAMGAAGFFAGKIMTGGGENGANKAQTAENGAAGEQQGTATQGNGQKSEESSAQGQGGQGGEGEPVESAEVSAKRMQGILALEPFTVNLNDPFGRRYIEVVLNLVIEKKSLVPKIKENELLMPKIRHIIMMTISGKSYSELKSTSGKITLMEEIQMRVNEILMDYMEKEPVIEVLYTKFLIQ
jgi:flagellar protein FliL